MIISKMDREFHSIKYLLKNKKFNETLLLRNFKLNSPFLWSFQQSHPRFWNYVWNTFRSIHTKYSNTSQNCFRKLGKFSNSRFFLFSYCKATMNLVLLKVTPKLAISKSAVLKVSAPKNASLEVLLYLNDVH